MTAETAEKRANPTADTLAKIDAWMQRLADETDQAAQSAELTRYLTTLSRFYTYSARNCILIAVQRPDATRVAGYRAWQALGRQVKKGAKGIAILCPAPITAKTDDGEAITVALRFRTGYVFDVADTEGGDLPEVTVHAVTGARYDALLRQLVGVAERGGLRVRFLHRLPDDANGMSYGDGRIDLCANRPDGNMCKTLIHEIAHERLHGVTERATFTTQQLECQAEAVAYGVCQALAVPCPNTPTYLALYRIDRATLAANLDAIRAGVAALIQEITPTPQGRDAEDIAA
jgi:hypothetical protein